MKSRLVLLFLVFWFCCVFSFARKNNNEMRAEEGNSQNNLASTQDERNERRRNRKNEGEKRRDNSANRPSIKGRILHESEETKEEEEKKDDDERKESRSNDSIKDMNKNEGMVSSSEFSESSQPSYSSDSSIPSQTLSPPRLMRLPYRRSSDETLRFPDSVGVGVEGEPTLEEIEINSKEIANAVNVQMKTQKKGRVMIALTELTHPISSFDEDGNDYIQLNHNIAFDEFNNYDIENDTSIYNDEEEEEEEDTDEIKRQINEKENLKKKKEEMIKQQRKAAEMKRLQQLRESVHNDLNIEILKAEGIIKDARLLDSIGLLVLDFDESTDEEKIRETLKQLWHVNKGIWLIEADADVGFRMDEEKKKKEIKFQRKEEIERDGNNLSLLRRKKEINEKTNSDGHKINKNNENIYDYISNINDDADDIYVEEKNEHDTNEINKQNEQTLLDIVKYYYGDFIIENGNNVFTGNTLNSQIDILQKVLNENNNYNESISKNEEKMDETIVNSANNKYRQIEDLVQREQKEDIKKEEELEKPNDTHFHRQWGLYNKENRIDIRFLEARKLAKKLPKAQVVIAHIDTGADLTHSDLKDSIWKNEDEIPGNGIDDDGNGYADDVHGWNFEGSNTNVNDVHGHGTHTAGILGATTNNKNGIAGISDSVKIMVLKFRNLASDAVAAIEYSLKKKVFASTNSWGFTSPVESLRLAIEKTRSHGQLFICAVDNRGSDNTWYSDYPPNWRFDNMIRVASMQSNGRIDITSNYGKNNVDLAAPGKNILSTVPPSLYNGKNYAYKDGTSMATPFVAGVAALLKSIKPELSAADIRTAIISSVTTIRSLHNKVISKGMLNAENAVKHVLGIPYLRNEELNVVSEEVERRPGFFFPYAYDLASLLTKLRVSVSSYNDTIDDDDNSNKDNAINNKNEKIFHDIDKQK